LPWRLANSSSTLSKKGLPQKCVYFCVKRVSNLKSNISFTFQIYPPENLIFNAFQKTPFKDLKVLIVGQDPYINENEAMGLCFSIPKGTKVPPSLKNIYLALENDSKVEFKTPNPIHGDLTPWAKKGVLLLNAILTVQ